MANADMEHDGCDHDPWPRHQRFADGLKPRCDLQSWQDKWHREEHKMTRHFNKHHMTAVSRHLRTLLLALDMAEGVTPGTNKVAMSAFLKEAVANYGKAMIYFKEIDAKMRREEQGNPQHRAAQGDLPESADEVARRKKQAGRKKLHARLRHVAIPSEHLGYNDKELCSRSRFIQGGLAQLRAVTVSSKLRKPSTHRMLDQVQRSLLIPWNQDNLVYKLRHGANLIVEQMEVNGITIFTNPDSYQFSMKECRQKASELHDSVVCALDAELLVEAVHAWLQPASEASLLRRLSKRGVWLYCLVYTLYSFCQQLPEVRKTYERIPDAPTEDDNTMEVLQVVYDWAGQPDSLSWHPCKLHKLWLRYDRDDEHSWLLQAWRRLGGHRWALFEIHAGWIVYSVAAIVTLGALNWTTVATFGQGDRLSTASWVAFAYLAVLALLTAFNSRSRAVSLLSFSPEVYEHLKGAADRIGNDRMSVAICLVYAQRLLEMKPEATSVQEPLEMHADAERLAPELAMYRVRAADAELAKQKIKPEYFWQRSSVHHTRICTERECDDFIKAVRDNVVVHTIRVHCSANFFQVAGGTAAEQKRQNRTYELADAINIYTSREENEWANRTGQLRDGEEEDRKKADMEQNAGCFPLQDFSIRTRLFPDSLSPLLVALSAAHLRRLDLSSNNLAKDLNPQQVLPLISELWLHSLVKVPELHLDDNGWSIATARDLIKFARTQAASRVELLTLLLLPRPSLADCASENDFESEFFAQRMQLPEPIHFAHFKTTPGTEGRREMRLAWSWLGIHATAECDPSQPSSHEVAQAATLLTHLSRAGLLVANNLPPVPYLPAPFSNWLSEDEQKAFLSSGKELTPKEKEDVDWRESLLRSVHKQLIFLDRHSGLLRRDPTAPAPILTPVEVHDLAALASNISSLIFVLSYNSSSLDGKSQFIRRNLTKDRWEFKLIKQLERFSEPSVITLPDINSAVPQDYAEELEVAARLLLDVLAARTRPSDAGDPQAADADQSFFRRELRAAALAQLRLPKQADFSEPNASGSRVSVAGTPVRRSSIASTVSTTPATASTAASSASSGAVSPSVTSPRSKARASEKADTVHRVAEHSYPLPSHVTSSPVEHGRMQRLNAITSQHPLMPRRLAYNIELTNCAAGATGEVNQYMVEQLNVNGLYFKRLGSDGGGRSLLSAFHNALGMFYTPLLPADRERYLDAWRQVLLSRWEELNQPDKAATKNVYRDLIVSVGSGGRDVDETTSEEAREKAWKRLGDELSKQDKGLGRGILAWLAYDYDVEIMLYANYTRPEWFRAGSNAVAAADDQDRRQPVTYSSVSGNCTTTTRLIPSPVAGGSPFIVLYERSWAQRTTRVQDGSKSETNNVTAHYEAVVVQGAKPNTYIGRFHPIKEKKHYDHLHSLAQRMLARAKSYEMLDAVSVCVAGTHSGDGADSNSFPGVVIGIDYKEAEAEEKKSTHRLYTVWCTAPAVLSEQCEAYQLAKLSIDDFPELRRFKETILNKVGPLGLDELTDRWQSAIKQSSDKYKEVTIEEAWEAHRKKLAQHSGRQAGQQQDEKYDESKQENQQAEERKKGNRRKRKKKNKN